MIQKVLAHYRFTQLTCVGLVLFFAVFIAALGWVFRKGSANFYEQLSQLPLQDLEPKGENKHV